MRRPGREKLKTRMPPGKEEEDDGKTVQHMPRSTLVKSSGSASGARQGTSVKRSAAHAPMEVVRGGQGRVKDPAHDRRLARNRPGPTGQGRVKDAARDKRLAKNRPGPTGQGRVKNP